MIQVLLNMQSLFLYFFILSVRRYDIFNTKSTNFCAILSRIFWKYHFIVFEFEFFAKNKANGDKYGDKYERALKAKSH